MKKIYLILFLGVFSCTIYSQKTQWIVYNTSNSGLPNNRVITITPEDNGNIWFGTTNGVAKFNGNNWTVFNSTNSGLPDNFVRSFAIDGSGNKWIV